MSDFSSNYWSIFVAVVSVLGIVYCALLLWFSSQVKVQVHNPDDLTTGHIWDETLQEMNNPLPRWWLWLFILTMVFAVFYYIAYPGLGSFGGQLGWTSQNEYDQEIAQANKALEPIYAAFDAQAPNLDWPKAARTESCGLPDILNTYCDTLRTSSGVPTAAAIGGICPTRPLVMVSFILSGLPPCNQSLSVRLGKPFDPLASEP